MCNSDSSMLIYQRIATVNNEYGYIRSYVGAVSPEDE